MLKVGLTGSIAVGKSSVLGVLAELGCHVLDADATAREVVAPGTPGMQAVVDAFGEDILDSERTLDRAKLGVIVFADETKRLQLRLDAINLFNHPEPADPNLNINNNDVPFGNIDMKTGVRQFQLGMRLEF